MTLHFLAWQSHRFDRYLFKTMALGNEQSFSLEVIITNDTFGQRNMNFGIPSRKISRCCFATTSVFIEKLLKTRVRRSKERITIAKSFYKLNPKIILFSIPIDVINLCGRIRIRKSCHYGGQAYYS